MSVRHLAKLAGLSKTAVSLALQDSPKISRAAKVRVRRLARQIGYRPDAKVRELMSRLRASGQPGREACLGLISLYPQARPWEKSTHLARIHAGMRARAEALGYGLEPIGMRTPGMTFRRVRAILDARGIEGLLCFGGPDFDEEFPSELDHYAIVTVGLSIKTQLHRVITHSYRDIWDALERLHALGYRRPGLIIGRYEEVRNGRAHLSAYFGWCEHVLGAPFALPVLRQERVEPDAMHTWLKQQRPDVALVVHHYDAVPEIVATLRGFGVRIPQDLGVAVLTQHLDGTDLAGMRENQRLMGEWAVELLVARIMNRDFGIPSHPRVEMVESEWIGGTSLRAQT